MLYKIVFLPPYLQGTRTSSLVYINMDLSIKQHLVGLYVSYEAEINLHQTATQNVLYI